jgi:hypothetical protein
VSFDLDTGVATLSLQDLALPDSVGGEELPAAVSLVMQWSGATTAASVADPAVGFAGSYGVCSATIAWSASNAGFSFVSDPAPTSVTRFAQIGRESIGSFAVSPSLGRPSGIAR